MSSSRTSGLSTLGPMPRWLLMIAISLLLGGVLLWLAIPAAMLLGPIIAGIVMASMDAGVEVPTRLMGYVQGLIGCMIAGMLPLSMSLQIGSHWLLFISGVLSVIVVCAALGWLLTRMGVLPGTTAMWGLSPGAATVMTVMAEAHGADAQLVALMQYLRVIMVAAVASVMMRLWGRCRCIRPTAWSGFRILMRVPVWRPWPWLPPGP